MQDTLHACILHACTLAPTLRLPTRRPQPHSQLLATRRPQPQPCAPLVHHTPTRPPIDSLDRLQRAATAAALPSSPCVYASCAPLATQPNLCCGCPASLTMAAQPPRSITLRFPLFSGPRLHSSCGHSPPSMPPYPDRPPLVCLQLHRRMSGYLPISFHPRRRPCTLFSDARARCRATVSYFPDRPSKPPFSTAWRATLPPTYLPG